MAFLLLWFSDMHLRSISSSEFSKIQTLAKSIWPICYKEILSKEQISYMLDLMYSEEALVRQAQAGQEFFLLEEDEELYGFLGIQKRYPEAMDIRVHKIYVRTDLHGKGLGKFMLHFVEALGKQLEMKRIHLNVNRFNKAKTFYEKMGFVIEKQEDIDIGHGYLMEDFVMVKKI